MKTMTYLKKDPLSPLDVIYISSSNLSIPIITKSQHFQLTFEVGNIFNCCFCWLSSSLYSILFCGQSKRIPTNWVQHIKSIHSPVSCHDVGRYIKMGENGEKCNVYNKVVNDSKSLPLSVPLSYLYILRGVQRASRLRMDTGTYPARTSFPCELIVPVS